MELNSEFQVPAILCPIKNPMSIEYETGWYQRRLGLSLVEKNILPLSELELRIF